MEADVPIQMYLFTLEIDELFLICLEIGILQSESIEGISEYNIGSSLGQQIPSLPRH